MFKRILILTIIGVLITASTVTAETKNTSGAGILYSDKGVITGVIHNSDTFNISIFTSLNFTSYDIALGVDIGHSKKIFKHLRLGAEVSMAYINPLDREKKHRGVDLGIGAVVAIPFDDVFELVGTYNTLKGVSGGFVVRF